MWLLRKLVLTSCRVEMMAAAMLQVGLVGLVEREWLVTLATVEPEEVEYTDFVVAAKMLLPQLKQEV